MPSPYNGGETNPNRDYSLAQLLHAAKRRLQIGRYDTAEVFASHQISELRLPRGFQYHETG